MAKLLPPVFGRRLSSDAEAKAAQRFQQELPAPAVLMHSVGLVRHKSKRWAEADFVLVCAAGIFCLEVKGGRVARRDGVWTFTDRRGAETTKHEGPFDQAGGAAGALQSWLSDAGVRRDDGQRFQVGYAVITPDCALSSSGPDIEPDLLHDQRHSEETMNGFAARLGSYWQQRSSHGELNSAEIDRLVDAIRPDFDASTTRSLTVGHVEEQLIRATEEQAKIMAGLIDNERLIVRGPAGTGKSMLAVDEANRLAAMGRSVLMVCHTPALAEALIRTVDSRVEVRTIEAVLNGIVDRAGMSGQVPDATSDMLFEVFLPELAVEALEADPTAPRYDALIIDEGQDLLRGDSISVLERLLIGGLKTGRWRAFIDPNQNLFGQIHAEPLALLHEGNPGRFRLTENCRNTQQIVEYVKILAGADVSGSSDTNGPEVVLCNDWAEPWQQRVARHAQASIDDGLRPDDILVVVAQDSDVRALARSFPDLFSVSASRDQSQVATASSCKGLEASAVILGGFTSLDTQRVRQMTYVAATRARVLLTVVLPSAAKSSYQKRIEDYAASFARLHTETRE